MRLAVERIPLMEMTLQQIAHLVGGQIEGAADLLITGANTIRDARPGELTFVQSGSAAAGLAGCQASAVLTAPGLNTGTLPRIVVPQAAAAFAEVVKCFRPVHQPTARTLSPAAFIAPTAKLGPNCLVHPGATIGDHVEVGADCEIHAGVRLLPGCKVGNQVTIFPNAVLYENTIVGNRAIIHANAVLGAYGFGYDSQTGKHLLSAQLGNVVIEDDVEIGACTTIDRGTFGSTTIGSGTKIDNQVMIAHNCRIGRHNMICSQVGVAGSCTTGDYVVMAGQVGLRDHIAIGDRAILGAKSGVMNNIPADGVYLGIPATPEREQMVKQAALAKLPELRKEFRALQRQLEALELFTEEPIPHSQRHHDAA
jgi:UDP-3-O-[3-hydroxymyristoyl] glucosamine N-acyltransferase